MTAEERGRHERDQETGDDERELHQLEQHLVEAPPEIATGEADRGPDQRGCDRSRDRNLERRGGSVEDPRQDVPAELVRSERMAAGRPLEQGFARLERVAGRQRGDERGEQDEQEEGGAQDEPP